MRTRWREDEAACKEKKEEERRLTRQGAWLWAAIPHLCSVSTLLFIFWALGIGPSTSEFQEIDFHVVSHGMNSIVLICHRNKIQCLYGELNYLRILTKIELNTMFL